MIHTVIFDIGGTLVKARSSLISFSERLTQNRDNDLKEKLLAFLIKEFMLIYRDKNPAKFIGIKDIIAIILKKAAEKFNVEDISGQAHQLYGQAYLNHANLFDDTIPTLKKLKKKNIKLIVASDADPDVLNDELSTFEINQYFDEMVISGVVGAYKPSDKMIDAILEKCEKPYSDILFVGDTEPDILSAKKIGAKSILIKRNGDFAIEADYHITNLDKIFEIIDNN